ncbi:MAG: adenosylcobinamide-GDP ribazoletransferase [Planctomycetes bacterium]|nr:adenosylcobinamide-GDP ribazoletransferase [Planctomycetota bacterium]
MKYFSLAVTFLTIIPVRLKETPLPGDLGKAAGWFPVIGAVIGGLVAAAYYGLSLVFPSLLAAALAASVWIGLTGGLHLDGLADCCDGMLNASSRERRLEIMKDPRLGTFGGVGLLLAILLKIICLYSLPTSMVWIAVPLAAVVGRWLLLPAGKQPLARPGGMGADFTSGLNKAAFIQAGLVVGILTALAGWRGLLVILVVYVVTWLVLCLAKARLGGVTGDVLGLVVELAELVTMIGFCVR